MGTAFTDLGASAERRDMEGKKTFCGGGLIVRDDVELHRIAVRMGGGENRTSQPSNLPICYRSP